MGGGGGGNYKPVCVDCGAHAGLITDIILHCGGRCYTFEPNKYLHAILSHKYANNSHVILHNQAVSDRNYTTKFLHDGSGIIGQGNGITATARAAKASYEVEVVDLSEILENLIEQYGRVYLLKLDVEGAEFGIMEAILDKQLYKHIDYIACETHERFFHDGDVKIAHLHERIAKEGATNILLDWI